MSLFAKLSTYDERSARLAGIGLMLLSIFMFSFGDALGKFLMRGKAAGALGERGHDVPFDGRMFL